MVIGTGRGRDSCSTCRVVALNGHELEASRMMKVGGDVWRAKAVGVGSWLRVSCACRHARDVCVF